MEGPELDIQIGAVTLLLDALTQTAPDENIRKFIRLRLNRLPRRWGECVECQPIVGAKQYRVH
ncbi:Uncharacterized protein PPKH_4947 [Pseudomonas putida]|nr:Uncharacterized protein PPKH_4947 [Pseudomonas putida]